MPLFPSLFWVVMCWISESVTLEQTKKFSLIQLGLIIFPCGNPFLFLAEFRTLQLRNPWAGIFSTSLLRIALKQLCNLWLLNYSTYVPLQLHVGMGWNCLLRPWNLKLWRASASVMYQMSGKLEFALK